jgi:hypothetical protein
LVKPLPKTEKHKNYSITQNRSSFFVGTDILPCSADSFHANPEDLCIFAEPVFSNSAGTTMLQTVLVTGASGMVGEGVLHACLQDASIGQVLVLGRKPCGHTHPKLREILHGDFFDLRPVADHLRQIDACLFCLGVSSVGMDEATFHRMTYELTNHMAEVLVSQNPGMAFCYISGSGTDSTEKGRMMWARVKGKTENRIFQLFGDRGFAFRPGYLHPTPGLKNTLSYYRYITWMYPLFKALFPGYVSTLQELGKAMIEAARNGYPKQVLEVKDIVQLAAR